jgi:hypothetical protein
MWRFFTGGSHVGCIASTSIGLSELPDLVLTRLGIFPFGFKGAFGGTISLGFLALPGGKYSLTLYPDFIAAVLRGAFNGSTSLGFPFLTLDAGLVETGLKMAFSERSSGTSSPATMLVPPPPFHTRAPESSAASDLDEELDFSPS